MVIHQIISQLITTVLMKYQKNKSLGCCRQLSDVDVVKILNVVTIIDNITKHYLKLHSSYV